MVFSSRMQFTFLPGYAILYREKISAARQGSESREVFNVSNIFKAFNALLHLSLRSQRKLRVAQRSVNVLACPPTKTHNMLIPHVSA